MHTRTIAGRIKTRKWRKQPMTRDNAAMDQALGKYGVLALRLSLGTLFLAHGLLKLLVFTIPGTVAYFEKLGFPGFFAYLTIFAELGGGNLLIAGNPFELLADVRLNDPDRLACACRRCARRQSHDESKRCQHPQ